MRTRHPGISLVQTTDFFYPLVDDPYAQGKITAANVLSDLYAMGVADCDNVLMLLALSMDMSEQQRAAVAPLLLRGFAEHCALAGTSVNGGQTVKNPWTIVGGVASTVCVEGDFIMPDGGRPGDVLVLTKPIGTQVAVNAHQWMSRPASWQRLEGHMTREEVVRLYRQAMWSMARLNRTGARLMHKYGVHGATDVTGFGLLGHARNLAEHQRERVDLIIDTLPVFAKTPFVNSKWNYKLLDGLSAETSGGLLMMVPADRAEALCQEMEAIDGVPAWIVGRVVAGSGTAVITPDARVIEFDGPEL